MFNYGMQCNVLDAKILNDMIGYLEIKKGRICLKIFDNCGNGSFIMTIKQLVTFNFAVN